MNEQPARPKGRSRLGVIFLVVLLLNSAFLAVFYRMPGPPRLEITAFFYLANLVGHLGLGAVGLGIVLFGFRRIFRAIREGASASKPLGILALLAFIVALGTGTALVIYGNLRDMENVRAAHLFSTVAFSLFAAGWFATRLKGAVDAATQRLPSKGVAALIMAIMLPAAGLFWYAGQQVEIEGRIVNPTIIPTSMDGEGDGPKGKFWPAAIESVDDQFFPPEYFVDSKSCGVADCHPDIYKQWHSSAHHLGSFNNQWYRKSIEYMQEVAGTQPSKWCGGCHDMAILLTEKPGTGKSRFDFPIKDQIWPPEKNPEAHAGIGCAACHSTVHVKSTMGNSDFVLDYPPMHKYILTTNPVMKKVQNFLTRIAPGPHRKTFLKPFHKEDTAKFCSSCHKVHLEGPVNNFRWFRGFNDYDAWQASGVSGFGARSFYYPQKDGKPDFKKCADCHMALTPSKDAGNIGGKVHNHRFLAANTALPYVNHDVEQLMLTQKFLRDGAVSVDIFALRREKGGPAKATKLKKTTPNSSNQAAPEGQAASLVGDVASTGHSGSLMQADVAPVNEDVIAPLKSGAVAVKRGESVLIDLVFRTRKVGHAFPGGTFDGFDVWAELQAKDENGKLIFWSGSLEFPDGPVDRSAHQYRALLVDGAGNEINKRNAWAARARVYARAIPPGAADTVHYRLKIPKDCGNKITLTAKLNYRKFSWWNTQFAFGGRPEMKGDPSYSSKGFIEGVGIGKGKTTGPVTLDYDNRPMKFDGSLAVTAQKDQSKIPVLPITTLCDDVATLDVVSTDPKAATAPRALDPKKDRERFNDYGIGYMLQGDFSRATKAFEQVCKISPEWPEGYVNIGRVRFLEGDLKQAGAMLEKALAMYAAKPTPMTPYLKARTQFFYGLVLKGKGGMYDQALKVWTEAAATFPDDRELRNQMGRVQFLKANFEAAIKEFEHVLTIDGEDLAAHYNLMLCYRGKGETGAKKEEYHRKLYYRFKNDESTTHIAGIHRRKNAHDNHEAQPVHEHGSAPVRSTKPPTEVKARTGVKTAMVAGAAPKKSRGN